MDSEGLPRVRRRRWRRLTLAALALAGAAAFAIDRQVVNGFAGGRCRDRLRVYAAPREIAIGQHLERSGIPQELATLGYRPVDHTPDRPGLFRRTADRLEIYLRAAPQPGRYGDRPPELVTLALANGRVRDVVSATTGRHSDALELEPELLEGVLDEHWTARAPFRLDRVPPHVVDAILAAEDSRFLNHPGLDLGSLVRALRVNWRAGEYRQGGSTITQQVVKNHFLTQDRTLGRKLREIPMALALELRFTKKEILECYLSTVYLGNDHLIGVYGLGEAARVYFDKPVERLTIGEAATLGGMIRAPNALSPLRHPERAQKRRNQVLDELLDLGWINPAQAAAARAEKLPDPPPRAAPPEAYFLRQVRRQLDAEGLGPDALSSGSAVFTTLDPRLQRVADHAAQEAARRLENGPGRHRGVQVAVVALDPDSGAVRALVGGRDYLKSQLDRATQVRRPVGSLFKPFLYLAAIDDPQIALTPASILLDEPMAQPAAYASWSPQDSDQRFRGPVTVREAIEESLNVPAVRVAEQLGIDRLARFGESLAIGRAGIPARPAIALGAFDASLLDVVESYSIFPTGGRQVAPRFVEAVEAPTGVVLLRTSAHAEPVADPAPTYVVHRLLEGVVERGTGRRALAAHLPAEVAGKTGTTDDFRDAWFVGYTPSLVLGVWVGYDDGRSLPGAAAEVALPLWSAIAEQGLAGMPPERLDPPPGVELVEIDAATGRLAAPGCGPAVTEAFLTGTAPTASCTPRSSETRRAAASEERGGSPGFLDRLISTLRGVW